MRGVCLLCGVLSLAALPGEPQTLFLCQAAASGRDEFIQIWFSKSRISNSYVPSWGCGLGTQPCSLNKDTSTPEMAEIDCFLESLREKLKLFLAEC